MVSRDEIISALKQVFDPEIPVNVWDLGLIYDIGIGDLGLGTKGCSTSVPSSQSPVPVKIKMTMTSPTCPMAEEILQMVRYAVGAVPGVASVDVALVWEPQWDISRMSNVARLELDLTEEGW